MDDWTDAVVAFIIGLTIVGVTAILCTAGVQAGNGQREVMKLCIQEHGSWNSDDLRCEFKD